MADDTAIISFCDITGAEPATAVRVLEMAAGNLENALTLFFEHPELQAPAPTAPSASTAAASGTSRTGRHIGREDAEGIIHIDSDDDDDADVDYMDDAGGDARAVARIAQEDEDAAMARRLQEEMYSTAGGLDDGVRSPIAQRTETLLGDDDWGSGHDGASTGVAAFEAYRRRMQRHVGHASNPFNQSIWAESATTPAPAAFASPASGLASPASGSSGATSSRRRRLAELFRPPFDLMERLDWDEARDEGKAQTKWLLVNLQDMSDFNCQALNRDVWSNDAVKALVSEHFIFLQYTRDDMLSEKYISFYFPGRAHENPAIYPHVSIVDPRTGEQVKAWSGVPFPSVTDFHAQLVDFLDRYSLRLGSKNPVVTDVLRPRTVDVDRMTEDEMLEMALKNSLATTNGDNALPNPDALTRPPHPSSQQSHTPSSGPAQLTPTSTTTPTPPQQQEPSAFSRISSTTPHTEPAPSTPAAETTRIQFRHPNGRVIRRFRLDDPVRRLYEWLKAEPIEGMLPGGEFELKTVPAAVDLLERLDETVSDVGLKNGTVMIEFITD